MTQEIYLKSGDVTLIDDDDAELIAGYRWSAIHDERTTYVIGYALDVHRTERIGVSMHRVILAAPPGVQVDHINHDGLDNRRANLRLATRAQNAANSGLRSTNTSGYKGVSRYRSRWGVRIRRDGRECFLGLFDDPWEAAQAYNAAALKEWGEFAYLNVRIEREA